jgi:transposase-like protein
MQVQVSLKMEIGASVDLTQMEQQIQEAGQQAMREAMKQAIRQWEDQWRCCPHCGAQERRLEGTVRRTIALLFGRVQVPRRRFRCLSCGRRWCPANALLAPLKGGTMSQPLQEAAALVGCSWPYRVAAQALKRLSGAQISAEELRLQTNRQGKQRAARQQVEAQQSAPASEEVQTPTASSPEGVKEPMLVGLDGGWVCSREQRGGMEGKVAVVCSHMEDLPMPKPSSTFSWSQRGGPRRPPRQRHRLVKRRYVATFAPAKQLGELAAAAARRVRQDPKQPEVVIADGASWIKTEQQRHFPGATCILDWAHLWREVRGTLQAIGRAKDLSAEQQSYQRSLYRSRLWQGEVELVIRGLNDLDEGLEPEVREKLRQTIGYLRHQRTWMGSYEKWKQQGYPVGSGMIERAVSLVINRRMKKRGMRWLRPNATAVVALRTDALNEDWITSQPLRFFP